jgi:hypothetical protein
MMNPAEASGSVVHQMASQEMPRIPVLLHAPDGLAKDIRGTAERYRSARNYGIAA